MWFEIFKTLIGVSFIWLYTELANNRLIKTKAFLGFSVKIIPVHWDDVPVYNKKYEYFFIKLEEIPKTEKLYIYTIKQQHRHNIRYFLSNYECLGFIWKKI